MVNKRILFLSDVDGTIIKTRKPINVTAYEGIQRFIHFGGLFAVSTGRSLASTKRVLKEIPTNCPGIICGGSAVFDFAADEALKIIPMKENVKAEIQYVLDHYATVSVTVTMLKRTINLRKNNRLVTRGVEEDATAPMGSLDQICDPLKLILTCDDKDVLKELSFLFSKERGYTFKFASEFFCEVTDIQASKMLAAEYLRNYLRADIVFSAGDALSDMEMSCLSQKFFAPVTAMEEVKAQADFLFPSPELGGIGQAMDHVIKHYMSASETPALDAHP